ncbi:MAG: CapA family protein [Clostridiales bacterium]|nr:CapA family protein [Clostridiales bacterium]
MKKKLRADSVDELFEIVKAVQNGEEPEEYAKRKREEALRAEHEAEEAEKRKREEARAEAEAARQKRKEKRAAEREAEEAEKRRREEAAKRRREEEYEQAAKRKLGEEQEYEAADQIVHEKNAARLSDSDEEDFERMLEEGPEEDFGSLKSAAQGITERLKAVGSFLGEKSQEARETLSGWQKSVLEKRTSPKEKHTVQNEEHTVQREAVNESHADAAKPSAGKNTLSGSEVHTNENSSESPASDGDRTRELGRVRLADIEKEPVGKTRRRYGAKSVSEESETIGNRILHSLHMDSAVENQEEHAAGAGVHHVLQRMSSDPKQKDAEEIRQNQDEIDADSIDLDTVQILDRLLDGHAAQTEEATEQSAAENTSAKGTEVPEPEKASATGSEVPEPENGSVTGTEAPEAENTSAKAAGASGIVSLVKKALFGAKRRTVVIGSAAAVVVFIVIVAAGMLHRASLLQEKRKYVTADDGLIVTVENQPTEWCSSCELKMKVSVKSGAISSIEMDGIAVQPDEQGYVTTEVQSTPLEVNVTTENGTLAASVEIPMLDIDAPTVTADISGGQVVLAATDTRSGVAQIQYAVVRDDDWLQLPQYQQYSEPFAFEEDCLYYFYAIDQAGNCSTPLVSNMVTAQSITLSENEVTLYPEGTVLIEAEVNPSNALLTNLRFESSNTEVAVVSSVGLVTAVAEGSALIKVTADGVDMATCTVNVVTESVITVSAIGDCTLGTYKGSVTSTSFDTYYSMYGATWFFQNVKDILSNDDATFANLEGPLTDSTDAADKTYAFKGDPSYTEILQDGSIEVVTLANNHSSDYGSQGLADTKENLTEAGIDYCTGDTIAYQEISGVKTAFIGIYELASGLECETQVRETIADAQSEGAQLIIVAFHWGSEKENYADEIQQSLAHTAIDCGADLVVGHHPHVLQGIEKYNGKYIVYSLGNFCFGGNSNPSDKDTMIFRQTFTVTADGVTLDDDIEIIPCTLSSASGYNDYRPTPATGTAADEIMERINEYSAEFGEITYTASTGLEDAV